MQRTRERDADKVGHEEHVDDLVRIEVQSLRIFEKLDEAAAVGQRSGSGPSKMGEDEQERNVGEEQQ